MSLSAHNACTWCSSLCTYSFRSHVALVSPWLSLAMAVLHYTPSFLVATVPVELSPGPVYVVFSSCHCWHHLLTSSGKVYGVLDMLLYHLLVCFCHLLSVFGVHAHAHTQETNLSPSLHAITLVTCAQCTQMLTTLLIALGRLSAARTVVNTGNCSPTLAGCTALPGSPHFDLAINCVYM